MSETAYNCNVFVIHRTKEKKEGDSVSMVTGLRLSLTYTYPAPDVREVEEEMERCEEHTAIHSPQLTQKRKPTQALII